MRILLADDQPQVLSALRLVLAQEPDLRVVSEATNSGELLDQMENVKPDVVLLDWELPDSRSADLMAALHAICPAALVVAISGRPEARRAAREAGADAFASKGDPPDRLLAILRAVAAGDQSKTGC